MKIKVCGLKFPENLLEVTSLYPDFIGLIFYHKSPRYMKDTVKPKHLEEIPESIDRVGVFVNHAVDEIIKEGHEYKLDVIQLHGQEPVETCKILRSEGFRVIKVFPVGDMVTWDDMKEYVTNVDYFLFDTKTAQHGGSGRRFNWKVLNDYPFQVPFFLSGGIDLEHLEELNDLKVKPMALDINSKFESKPGLKLIDKIEKLKNLLHREINN